MRMAPHELLPNGINRVADRKLAGFLADLREEHGLIEVIAQLLPELLRVARVDRLEHFIRFLEHEWTQRRLCLLTVPGAAAGRAERAHDGDELVELLARRFCRRRTLNVRSGHGLVC